MEDGTWERRAFVYTDADQGTFTDIGDLGGHISSKVQSVADGFAINNWGEVTAWSGNADNQRRAFLYVLGNGMQGLGVINTRGWNQPESFGWDLNDGGMVSVGRAPDLRRAVGENPSSTLSAGRRPAGCKTWEVWKPARPWG